MKYVRFQNDSGEKMYGILNGERIMPILGSIFSNYSLGKHDLALSEVTLLAPCEPSKIVGAGANYHSFIQKRGISKPSHPRLFVKPSTAVANPGQEIYCPDKNDIINFEGELGVVIGKTCCKVKKENALDFVLGFTCINDITDITMMEMDKQWDRGKSVDTFLPFGPTISNEIDCFDTVIRTMVDGELRQDMSTSDMVFSVIELIEFISSYITLLPGDLIATGSPAGAGRFFPGQTVTIYIDGIGILENRMSEADE